MKGKFWRKALAAALALLIVSGGVPVKPFTDILSPVAITAEAVGEQIVTYTIEHKVENGRYIYYLVGSDGSKGTLLDAKWVRPTNVTLEMGDDITFDVDAGGNVFTCNYDTKSYDMLGFYDYLNTNEYDFTITSKTRIIKHVQIDGKGYVKFNKAKTSIEADGNDKTITVHWDGGSGGNRLGAPGKFIVTYATPVQTYNIKYELNGGTNSASNPSTYDDDKDLTLADPTRTGYTFAGWYTNSSFSGSPVTSIPVGSSGDKTLYAKWDINEYTITWKNYNGTILGRSIVEYGKTPSYGGKKPTKPSNAHYSYTFKGWSPSLTKVTGDQTYTAQFSSTVNAFTVTWKNDDTTLEKDTNVPYGTTPTYDGEIPAKEGDTKYTYEFSGWSPNVSSVTGNTVYNATFTQVPKSYNVTYMVDGEVYGEVETVAYGTELTPREIPVKTSYTFSGWSDIPETMPDKDIVITGTFSKDEHSITVPDDIANCSVSSNKTTAHYGDNVTLTVDLENGYYVKSIKAGSAEVTENADGTYSFKMPAEDVTVSAEIAANTYTVHFDVNNDNAYGEMTDQNFTYDEKQTLTVNAFGSTTGEFIKWNTEPDGSGTDYADGAEVQNLTAENGGIVTLYAQWHKMYLFDYDDSIFSCYVVGKENEKYWAYPGDTVQLNIIDNTHEYTITVKGKDGTDIAFDTSTNTFVMPNQPVKITSTSVKKIDNTSILLDSFEAWDDVSYIYDENNPTVTPIVTVKNGETTLTEGTDYTLSITNNTGKSDEVVTAIVTITGMGDYVGTNTKEFRITPFNIANCELKGKLEAYDDGYGVYYPLVNNVQVWNGDTQLESGTDYSLDIEYADSYEVGQTYTATIKGTGTWGGTKTFTFTVVELFHTVVFDSNGGTGTMASDVATKGQHYDLPECTFTAPYGYEFDYWEVSCEEGVEKQPGNYFTAPYIWSESDVQTITVTAHWKEKDKYSITLPDKMEIVSGVVTDGKAYADEVIAFKAKDGYTASNVMANDTALTADEYGVYTVNVNGDVTVSAEFNYVVIINSVDINGTATPTTVYAETFTAADYTVPSAPYMDGYNFKGWTVNDTLYTTVDEVQTAVETLVKSGTAVTVKVDYEKKTETHIVNVVDGTLVDKNQTSDTYEVADIVYVVANEAPEGQRFDHWEKNGAVVGYDTSYSFPMPSEDVTITAVYAADETPVEKKGTAYIESVTKVSENKLVFVSILSVPENCRIVSAGLVATNDDTIGADIYAESVTTNPTKKVFVKQAAGSNRNVKYTWTKSNVSADETWYVKAYLVYIDTNGNTQTVYGDLVTASIN